MAHSFLERLGVGTDADERSIRRAYARELKQIDQEADPAGFQSLREAYESALLWLRYRDAGDAEPEPVPQELAVESMSPEPEAQAPQQTGDDARTLAEEVFGEFLERCKTVPAECPAIEEAPWERELRRSLADPRLVSILGREIFEWHVACLLTSGWRLGHEFLLGAAIKVFGWAQDRRRVQGLGQAGAQLDQAISERVVFAMQPYGDVEEQRKLMVRLRNPDVPSTPELVRQADRLELLIARFPALLPIVTSASHVEQWRAMAVEVPAWRRKLVFKGPTKTAPAEQQTNRYNSGWLVFLVISGVIRLFMHFGGTPPQPPAPTHQAQGYESPATYRQRGERALEKHDYPEAVAAFTHALDLQPRNADTHVQRALAYEGSAQPELALEDTLEAIKLYPDMGTEPYRLSARLCIALGQPEKAGGAAEAMLVALPDRPEAYLEAARIYRRLNMEQQALAVFERGFAAMPKSGTLYSLRAQFRPKSDIEGRRKDLEQAVLLEPHNYSALAQRADIEAAARNYAVAIGAYTVALEQGNPKGLQLVAALTGRGLAETMAGKQAAAADDFKQAQESAKTPSGLNFICWNLATNNIALPTALASCDAALAKSPRIAAILDSRGFTLLRMGRYHDAITAYDAAIDVRPGLAGSLLGRGLAKRRSGDAQGGAADISAAQKLDPEVVGEFASYGVRI